MSVGDGALVGNLSYLSVGRELTYGSYNTASAGLGFLSAAFKTSKDVKILEEIQTSRTNSHHISLSKSIEGSIEGYFAPKSDACNYLLHNAFGGGAITSATATGETAGGAAFTHTININNFLTTYSSLCVNLRKGDSTNGKIFEYSGLRVNELSLNAEIDEALMMSVSLIGKDSTLTSNDVSGVLSTDSHTPLSFVNGRFSVESSSSSLTSSSYWNVQNISFKIANDLKSDSASRRIGSDVLQVLPAGMASFELKATVRFDTTTAFAAMIANTRFSAEFEFLGDTLTTSIIRQGLKMTFPCVYIKDAGDPEIGGPGEMLTSEVTFAVLRDPTTSGYACKAYVTNATSSYA